MKIYGVVALFLIFGHISVDADQVRLAGSVQLWDKDRLSASDTARLINSGVTSSVTLDTTHPNQHFWHLDDNEITPLNNGKWQTFGRYNGDEKERLVPMIGKVGKYFSPEPYLIYCKYNQGLCTGTIILRSPSNAAAWKFDSCLKKYDSGTASELATDTIACLKKARHYSEKEVIDLQLADIYSREQQYGACFSAFDKVAKVTTSDKIRESAITNASECLEKSALLDRYKVEKFEELSEYIRDAFESGTVSTKKSRIRQMLLRRWFDAFNIRLAPSGDLDTIVNRVLENDELARELQEIYNYYFWSNPESHLSGVITRQQIKIEIKALAAQWERSY